MLLFVIDASEFNALSRKFMLPNPNAYDAIYPGFDYIEGQIRGTIQYKWQPGIGAAKLVRGFKGFVPLPRISAQDWNKPN